MCLARTEITKGRKTGRNEKVVLSKQFYYALTSLVYSKRVNHPNHNPVPRMPAPYVEDAPAVIKSHIPYILIVPHVESLGIYLFSLTSIMWHSMCGNPTNAERKKTKKEK
jgi:hypothetical protein